MNVTLPRIGELNRRAHIRLLAELPNTAFGLDQVLDAGIFRWAKMEPIYGLAIRAGMQVGEEITHLFWVRFAPGTKPTDFTASHVIECRGRRYRVMDAISIADADRFTRISAKDLGPV